MQQIFEILAKSSQYQYFVYCLFLHFGFKVFEKNWVQDNLWMSQTYEMHCFFRRQPPYILFSHNNSPMRVKQYIKRDPFMFIIKEIMIHKSSFCFQIQFSIICKVITLTVQYYKRNTNSSITQPFLK